MFLVHVKSTINECSEVTSSQYKFSLSHDHHFCQLIEAQKVCECERHAGKRFFGKMVIVSARTSLAILMSVTINFYKHTHIYKSDTDITSK